MLWVPLRTGYGQRSYPAHCDGLTRASLELKPFPDLLSMGVSFRGVTLR